MKKYVLLFAAFLMTTSGLLAKGASESTVDLIPYAYNYRGSIVFTEGGITFSVYPDGEFDFYMDDRVTVGGSIRGGAASITFNSGFDYSPYLQYDDYGAVIQIENIPIYYDFYGRVNQIGNVDIHYRGGRVFRVGGLHVYYDGGYFSHFRGYINVYNRYYVYRPFHRFFVRPAVNFCLVYDIPYRRFYTPIRYTYYRPYRFNYRRPYATLGQQYRNHNRVNRRASIYRNDRRVAVREARPRRGDTYANSGRNRDVQRNSGVRRNTGVSRNAQSRRNTDNAVVRRGGNTQNRASTIKRSDVRRGSTAQSRASTVKRSDVSRGSNAQNRASTVKRNEARRGESIKRDGIRTTDRSRKAVASSRSTVKRNSASVKRQAQSRKSTVRTAPARRAAAATKSRSVQRQSRAVPSSRKAQVSRGQRSATKVASRRNSSANTRKASTASSRSRTKSITRSGNSRSGRQ